MAHIASINRYTIRQFRDTGQITAFCNWTDTRGNRGTTSGNPDGAHMQALADRAVREGLAIEREAWSFTA